MDKVIVVTKDSNNSNRGWKVLREQWYYEPTYLIDDNGECSVFARRFQILEKPNGKLETRVFVTVKTYPNKLRMVDSLDTWLELPKEAEDNREWLPDDFKIETIVGYVFPNPPKEAKL